MVSVREMVAREGQNIPDTRRLPSGVFLFFVQRRRDTEARQGVPARRGCTKKHSEGAFSRQHSATSQNQSHSRAGGAPRGYRPMHDKRASHPLFH